MQCKKTEYERLDFNVNAISKYMRVEEVNDSFESTWTNRKQTMGRNDKEKEIFDALNSILG